MMVKEYVYNVFVFVKFKIVLKEYITKGEFRKSAVFSFVSRVITDTFGMINERGINFYEMF